MGVLSDDQFASLANTGGASRYLHSGKQVSDTDPANAGKFAVSFPGSMGHEADPAHPATRQQVHAHAEKMRQDPTLAAQPHGTVMQGGWPHEGKVYLDASQMVTGRRAAAQEGQRRSQIAIRDMSRGRDVYISKPEEKQGRRTVGSPSLGFTVRSGLGGKPSQVPSGAKLAGARRR